MNKIIKDYHNIPERLKSKFCKKQIEAVLKAPTEHVFSEYYYKDEKALLLNPELDEIEGLITELENLYKSIH